MYVVKAFIQHVFRVFDKGLQHSTSLEVTYRSGGGGGSDWETWFIACDCVLIAHDGNHWIAWARLYRLSIAE